VAQLYGLIARSESAEAIHGDDYLFGGGTLLGPGALGD
jgi:hypothetical protein